jgi:starch synthase
MNIVIVHPGSQHARHLVVRLVELGHNVRYITSFSFGSDSLWSRIIPKKAFNKRLIPSLPDKVIDRRPLLEPVPAVLQKIGFDPQTAYAIRNRLFQRSISRTTIKNADAVIGFDTSSRLLAEICRNEGVPFFLELTTVHPNEKSKWLRYIHEHYPQWPSNELTKSSDLVKDEEMEIKLASAVSTAADYVRRTYVEHARIEMNISVNPFGADVSEFHPKTVYDKRPVFLFLGVLNAAKGLPVLLDAWKIANIDAELVIGGYGEWPQNIEIPKGIKVIGRVAREEREAFFHSGDVFVSPSFYEGFGIVQLEAAACGLAVIATLNSGGPEVLTEGSEGFFVEAGNVEALAARIKLLANDPELREKVGKAAAIKAQSVTWASYADRWLSLISNTLKK